MSWTIQLGDNGVAMAIVTGARGLLSSECIVPVKSLDTLSHSSQWEGVSKLWYCMYAP